MSSDIIGRRGVLVTGDEKLAVLVKVLDERTVFGRRELKVQGVGLTGLDPAIVGYYAWVTAGRVEVEA